MIYTTFSKKKNNQLKEPMFLGQSVNIARYDQQKYLFFENLIQKQLSFFWRPEEIDLSKDRIDFQNLSEYEKHIFVSNLKYQTLLDSIQGRSPSIALLPLVSIPELETWIQTWSFFETIHSRSYTHIIRNIFNEPSVIFDSIVDNNYIIKRAKDISKYYDKLISITNNLNINNKLSFDKDFLREIKKSLYLCLISINALEAIRFYVSFACSFSFAERNLMEGNAKVIRFIARDESLHLLGTQKILNIMNFVKNENMIDIVKECKQESYDLYIKVSDQEKEWANYLFSNESVIGLNKKIIYKYIEYITNLRMKSIYLNSPFKINYNPLPWINNWLISENIQIAPQETEISSYLVGQVDSEINTDVLSNIEI